MAVKTLEVRPLNGPHHQFGAEIDHVDMEHISDADFEVIRQALYNYHVVVLKNQAGVSPKGKQSKQFLDIPVLIKWTAQYELTKRFDPACDGSYGHGKTLDAKRSVLHPDLKTIPHQPQVQVIGNGHYD